MIEWYEFVNDDRLTMKVEFWRRAAFVHCTIHKPVSGTRAVRVVFPPMCDMLRAIGHKVVYALVEGERRERFCKMFGLRTERRFGALTLMKKEI